MSRLLRGWNCRLLVAGGGATPSISRDPEYHVVVTMTMDYGIRLADRNVPLPTLLTRNHAGTTCLAARRFSDR